MRKTAHALVMAQRHLTGRFRVREIDLLRKFISKESVCMDIGAHAGSWSRPLSSLATNGTIYCFEALPYYADVLRILFRLLRMRNAEVVNVAVSDKEGSLRIAWKDESGNRLTGLTHILGNKEASSFTVEVPSTSLDRFVAVNRISRIDFIKVDVEGAEMSVYTGAQKALTTFRPVVFCELDERWTTRYEYATTDVFDYFEALGYKSYTIPDGATAVPTDKHSYSKRGDVLFIPAEKAHKLAERMLNASRPRQA